MPLTAQMTRLSAPVCLCWKETWRSGLWMQRHEERMWPFLGTQIIHPSLASLLETSSNKCYSLIPQPFMNPIIMKAIMFSICINCFRDIQQGQFRGKSSPHFFKMSLDLSAQYVIAAAREAALHHGRLSWNDQHGLHNFIHVTFTFAVFPSHSDASSCVSCVAIYRRPHEMQRCLELNHGFVWVWILGNVTYCSFKTW